MGLQKQINTHLIWSLLLLLSLCALNTSCDGFSLDSILGEGEESASDESSKDDSNTKDDKEENDTKDEKKDDDTKDEKKENEKKENEKKEEPESDPHMPAGKASDKIDDRPKDVLAPKTDDASSLATLLRGTTKLEVSENNIPFKSLELSKPEFAITDSSTIQSFTDAISKQGRLVPECPKCMTTITIRALSSSNELASLDLFCGGTVDTAVVLNTLSQQCWVLDEASEVKKILEDASK